jgi:ATP-dependent DNA ligase
MAGQDLSAAPQSERRASLEHGLRNAQPPLFLTPATTDRELAALWFERFEGAGLDGVVAKRLESLYVPAERVMLKVKHQRTADCVVGAFRWNRGQVGKMVGSLLLGLYDEKGSLHHVGFTSSFKAAERREMIELLAPYREFDRSGASTGNWFGWEGWQGGQGAQSRWSHGKEVMDWIPLRPELVCEVAFDHWQGEPKPADNRGWLGGGRFRHGTTFLRWRSDKPPLACDFDQLTFAVPIELREVFGQ